MFLSVALPRTPLPKTKLINGKKDIINTLNKNYNNPSFEAMFTSILASLGAENWGDTSRLKQGMRCIFK